jgi:hypothetical protein
MSVPVLGGTADEWAWHGSAHTHRPNLNQSIPRFYIGVNPLLTWWVHFSLGANSPFDKLRANGQAFPFALSLSKGSFPPT